MTLTQGIGTVTGLTVVTNGEIMTVNGFPMRIIIQCTAIHYIIIVSCAIMLSSWHSTRYRLTGVAIAVPLLVLFNSIRLLVTGLAGTISRSAFVFFHSYLWLTVFILLTFAMWAVWDRRLSSLNIKLSRYTVIAVILSSLFQILLFICSYRVDRIMALLASCILKLLPGTSGLTIEMYAGKVMLAAGHRSFTFSISAELVVLAVYVGLAITEVIQNDFKNAVRMTIGGVVLLLLSIIIITSCCLAVIHWGMESATLFFWVCQGVMMALPIAIWWVVVNNNIESDDCHST